MLKLQALCNVAAFEELACNGQAQAGCASLQMRTCHAQASLMHELVPVI